MGTVRAFIFACTDIDLEEPHTLVAIRRLVEDQYPVFAATHPEDVEAIPIQREGMVRILSEAPDFSECMDSEAGLAMLDPDPVLVIALCDEDCQHRQVMPPISLTTNLEAIDKILNGFAGRLKAWYQIASTRQAFACGDFIVITGVFLHDDEGDWVLVPQHATRSVASERIVAERFSGGALRSNN